MLKMYSENMEDKGHSRQEVSRDELPFLIYLYQKFRGRFLILTGRVGIQNVSCNYQKG